MTAVLHFSKVLEENFEGNEYGFVTFNKFEIIEKFDGNSI